jgi:[ribosomal protein S18]-alanine N-acetyltransferase
MSTFGPLHIAEMTQADAQEIADWHYDPPYDFHDMRADPNDLDDLLDAKWRGARYFTARQRMGGELVGFLELRAEGAVTTIGLGLRPDLTGRGLGAPFVESCLDFALRHLAPERFRLTVAEFNARAITVYERAGFVRTRTFLQETNGGRHPFVEMERPA